MKRTIYMLVGSPGTGKSYVAEHLKNEFEYIPHDGEGFYGGAKYLQEINKKSLTAKRPLLIETPFSMSQLKEPLEKQGHKVIPVFIQESERTVALRYHARGKLMPAGFEARQRTYAERAKAGGHFQGTSEQVLQHLKKIARGA